MQFRQLHTTLLFLLCAAVAACSKEGVVDEQTQTQDTAKTPIELCAGWADAEDDSAVTRTVITDDKLKPHSAFPSNTSMYMLMQSDYIGESPAKDPWVTRTIMFALPQTNPGVLYSDVNYSASNEYDKFVKYWDDVYARDAAISIVAVCTPGMGPNIPGQNNTKAWIIGNNNAFANQTWTHPAGGGGGGSYTTISWPIGNETQITFNNFLTDQSRKFDGVSYIKNQDLCFSNNLNDNRSYGDPHGDGRLKFNWETRKFNSGRLIFYHALSKLTFRIKKGEGFTDEQFKFNTNTNIKLTNFYSQGTFNLATGEFDPETLKKANGSSGQNDPINKIWQREDSELTEDERSTYKYILDALVIPGTDMTAAVDAVDFYIYDNEYKLTLAQLYEAFTEEQKTNFFESNKLKAGVHYIFTFTIGKQKIEKITASIVDWEGVNADEQTPTNARIRLNLEERGSNIATTSQFSFFRSKSDYDVEGIDDDYTKYDWTTGYTTGSSMTTPTYNTGYWRTTWFWDSNKDFFHFRALGVATAGSEPVVLTVPGSSVTANAEKGDSYPIASGVSYTDLCWGAPFLDVTPGNTDDNYATLKWKYGPTLYGFDAADDGSVSTGLPGGTQHQIYKAIGPTEDAVKLTLFHMMSDLTINITTTTGAEKVDLGDENTRLTHVFLEDSYANGKVLLGNGLVETTEDVSDQEIPQNSFTPEAGDPTSTPAKAVYKFGVVPQNLATSVNDGKGVQLRIVTPDKNEYIVDLKNVKATNVDPNNIANPYTQGNDSKYVISRWYPGYKYTYNFTLKKSQIDKIEVTIVGWETLETQNEDVTIQ